MKLGETRSTEDSVAVPEHRVPVEDVKVASQLLRLAVETSPDAMILAREDGTISFANRQAARLFGYPPEELLDLTIEDLVPSGQRKKHARHRESYLANPAVRPMGATDKDLELQGLRKDGTQFPAEISLGYLETEEGVTASAAIRDVTQRWLAELELKRALSEIERLKERAEAENVYLRDRHQPRHRHRQIVGESEAIRKVLAAAEQVAATDSTVLILGETGTGKELLARWIHRLSSRHKGLMVEVNCAGLPATLVESELFGRDRGAFTGALTAQKGRFELADRSTIFLDEVAELPLELQGKLLRVLQEGRFERLGNPRTIEVDVRVIAATNRNLEEAVREGNFREDLYYRLNVFPITMPPLRERAGDVRLLVWAFVEELAQKMGKSVDTISRDKLAALEAYPWPGNVRELRNVIERAMILSSGNTLAVDLPSASGTDLGQDLTFEAAQRRVVSAALERAGWRIRGEGGAAEALALKPTTLETKMRKLGIRRPG